MIGDSETDILTARNAGVPVIGVPFGLYAAAGRELYPDRMIRHSTRPIRCFRSSSPAPDGCG